MSDADDYILDAMKVWVWTGFYSPVGVDEGSPTFWKTMPTIGSGD